VISLLRGLQLALVAWIAAPTDSRATPLSYVFSNASTTLNGVPETITGLFSIDPDPAILIESAVIDLTGPPPYSGRYVASNVGLFSPNAILAFRFTDQLTISFANVLSFGDYPLAGVSLTGPRVNPSVADDAPTGFAVGPSAPVSIPETTSLALLATALGLFLLKTIRTPQTIRTLRITLCGEPPAEGSIYKATWARLPAKSRLAGYRVRPVVRAAQQPARRLCFAPLEGDGFEPSVPQQISSVLETANRSRITV